jgi:hypothetical protein
MTRNQGQLRIGQFAIDHMKVSAANSAGTNAHQQLSPTRLWLWYVTQLQGPSRFIQNHRSHGVTNDECRMSNVELMTKLE